MSEPERARKKRKGPAGTSILIGGRAICLDGYLNQPAKKADPPKNNADDTNGDKASAAETPPPSSLLAVTNGAAEGTAQSKSSGRKASRAAAPPRGNNRDWRGEWKQDATLLKARQQLPIWQHKAEIQASLRQPGHDVLVLVGETGSGKSTQIPQFLIEEAWCQRQKVTIPSPSSSSSSAATVSEPVWVGGMVAITQPRRVAATTLAYRVAQEAGTPLNGQNNNPKSRGLVGYSVRFEHRVPPGTRIKFLTEGMLLQELLHDSNLRQYSAIVVDEVHERSIDVDLLVGFLKQIVEGDKAGRGGVPLKVIIMSATADVDVIRRFFNQPLLSQQQQKDNSTEATETTTNDLVQVLRIQGRQHPVKLHHTPAPVPDIQDALLKTIFNIHVHEPLPGDILAFLTGQEEIEAAQKLVEEYASTLAPNAPKIRAFPLFGQLSIEAQHNAFQPLKEKFARKVVLATNIAETSVTVPGVRFVVDCGKAKLKQYRVRLGMESLLAKPISKSSAVQRTGRAGREAPGKCYRLYTQDTFDSLEVADLPEILRNDVLGAVLTMKARGVDDVLGFPLMDQPDREAIQRALVHLHFLGGLDDSGKITERGRQMARFPVTAPFARVLLAAAEPQFDCLLEVIDIVACLTAGDELFYHLHSATNVDSSSSSTIPKSEKEKFGVGKKDKSDKQQQQQQQQQKQTYDDEEVERLRQELFRREGDLLTYLTTMQQYTAENADRVEWCRRRRINLRNMRQAVNIRRQLRGLCARAGLFSTQQSPPDDPQPFVPATPAQAETVLRCFLKGFAFKTATLAPDGSYVTIRGRHAVAVHPASVMHGHKKEAILFLEHVFTQKSYAKKVSAIQASWIAEVLEGAW